MMTTTVERPTRGRFSSALSDGPASTHANARLVLSCASRPGTMARVLGFLAGCGADIVEADQHVSDGVLLARLVLGLDGGSGSIAGLRQEFAHAFADRPDLRYRLHDATRPKRAAVFVSRQEHCLVDLLSRARRGEMPIEVGLVVSNHADLAELVSRYGVPFAHVPVPPGAKAEAERHQCELVSRGFDLVVLARYMQILSSEMLDRLRVPVINLHHSLLPAFVGGRAYEQAKRRGVKVVGATAHYVTAELDAGPIIEQDAVRVSHRDSTEDLARTGRDVERLVLARAVHWHCEDRVLINGAGTVVF